MDLENLLLYGNISMEIDTLGQNFIAKFGRYVSIIGASEDTDKNIS
jgi:hypothetical protein